MGNTACADPLGRELDSAHQGYVIVRIAQQPEPRKHIFDFAPLIEAHPTNHHIRDTAPTEGFFERPTLGIGTVHDGTIGVSSHPFFDEPFNGITDTLRLFVLVATLTPTHRLAPRGLATQQFAVDALGSGIDEHLCDIENRLRAPVVLGQNDDLCTGKI